MICFTSFNLCHGLACITQIWLALTYTVTDCSADVGSSHTVFSPGRLSLPCSAYIMRRL